MHRSLAIFLFAPAFALFAGFAAPAQTPGAGQGTAIPGDTIVPEDCELQLLLRGWPTTQRLHAGDPMGRFMGSPAVAQAARGIEEALLPLLEETIEEGLSPDFPLTHEELLALPRLLVGLDGTVEIGVSAGGFLRAEEATLTGSGLVVALSSSDRAGLETLHKRVRSEVEKHVRGLEFAARTVRGIDLSVARLPASAGASIDITLPFFWKDRLCIVAAADLDAWLGRMAGAVTAEGERARRWQSSSLLLHCDVQAMLQLAMRADAASRGPTPAKKLREFFGLSGLTSVRAGEYRTFSRDGHQHSAATVYWPGGPTGVLRAFAPDKARVSSLQHLLPYAITDAQPLYFDASRALSGLRSLVAALDEENTFDLEASFERFFGLRLQADVLDHLDSDLLVLEHLIALTEEELLASADESELEARIDQKFDGRAVVIRLRNEAAFTTSLERIVRKLALHVSRKKKLYRDHPLATVPLPLVRQELHYAVCEGCFLIGLDQGGETAIHAVIDRIADAAEKRASPPPAQLQSRLEREPPGWYGHGHTDLYELGVFVCDSLRAMLQIFESIGEDPDFEIDAETRVLRDVLRALDSSARKLLAEFRRGAERHMLMVLRYERDRASLQWVW